MPLDYTRFRGTHLRRRPIVGRRAYKNTTVHSYLEGYFHTEACDYSFKGAGCSFFWKKDYSFTMTTPSASHWSLATGTTCYDPTTFMVTMSSVTTTCLEQQPLQEMEKLDPQQHKMFRTTVGQLIWASLDRPDLMYCAKLHSSRLQGPTERDLRSLKHTLRYLKGTTHYKLYIGRGLADYLPTNHNGTVTSRTTTSHWTYVVLQIQTGQETKLQDVLRVDGFVPY